MALVEKNQITEFLTSTTRRELASALRIKYSSLTYALFVAPKKPKYIEFEIKKRNGGVRKIAAPRFGLKYIQKRLADILLNIYPDKSCVQGYSKRKNIISNATIHLKKKILINLDLSDFFPSINFGRVVGVFKAHPFNFNSIVSTTLAQLCCYNASLPQGAPSSPIISNYICRRLDNKFINAARKYRFDYSRYADDITISTNIFPLSSHIGVLSDNKLVLSKQIIDCVENNGFKINLEKVRYATSKNRQEVTGIIVNKFPNVNRRYIRHIRAMIHAWEKFGIEKAASEHFEKYNYRFKAPKHEELSFQNELLGKIGFIGNVRGKNNKIYINLFLRLKNLNPEVKLSIVERALLESDTPLIFGEGRTDWKHLKAALTHLKSQGLFSDLIVKFENYEEGIEMNNADLLNICQAFSKTKTHHSKIICVFDRDVKTFNKKVVEEGKDYKDWGNDVFSILIPIPGHRGFEEVCIEHYYLDEDLLKYDQKSRRIFLSSEFDKETGNHLKENLICVNKIPLKSSYPKIIDNKVFTDNGTNVALSKNSFADQILNGEKPFDKSSFESFKPLFSIVSHILAMKPNPVEEIA